MAKLSIGRCVFSIHGSRLFIMFFITISRFSTAGESTELCAFWFRGKTDKLCFFSCYSHEREKKNKGQRNDL